MKTIRLTYPQWQGGDISRWIPEIEDRARSARGYWLGAQLLNFLVPAGNNQETYTVPVRLDPCERTVPDGMRMAEVIRVINDAAAASDLVALTIAELMPRTAIRLHMMLEQLPLITSSAMR